MPAPPALHPASTVVGCNGRQPASARPAPRESSAPGAGDSGRSQGEERRTHMWFESVPRSILRGRLHVDDGRGGELVPDQPAPGLSWCPPPNSARPPCAAGATRAGMLGRDRSLASGLVIFHVAARTSISRGPRLRPAASDERGTHMVQRSRDETRRGYAATGRCVTMTPACREGR